MENSEGLIGTPLEGVRIFRLKRHIDRRGSFKELYNEPGLHEDLGIHFVQDNISFSTKGVLRGMHFQDPNPQAKLVTVLRGEIFDAVVDLREGSKTYARWCAARLSQENGLQLYVPEGCAHGYLVLSDEALVFYKVTTAYDAEASRYLRWNDPTVGISWPSGIEPILSAKDENAPGLAELSR